MTDIVNAADRSRMMRGICSKNTKPERHVRSLLHRRGFRFRLHVRDLHGKPDIVLPRYRAVIFVNGCFWHGHTCPLFRVPATRSDFWWAKIERNRANDQRAIAALSASGWRVATVWECALRGRNAIDDSVVSDAMSQWLRGDTPFLDIAGARREDS
jgi:DNA mismatch endonuclease (patch repair protein)